MAKVDNKTQGSTVPSPAAQTARKNGVSEPASGRDPELSTKQFCSTKPTVHWVSDGWTCMSWEGADGQPGGYVVTNGQSAMFFDETGNMTFSTGIPGQSGCGGKLVFNSADQIHNANGTISIHAKGPKDTTRQPDKGSKKGESTKESHAYSLYAEGGIAIEAQGDDCGIKGDNITINALKTLTLKAGEAINIECGDGNGKVSIYTGDYNLNSSFNTKTLGGAEYTDGAGEKTYNTTQPGSVEATNSVGTINQTISGNYSLGILGHYNINATNNLNFRSYTGGIGISVTGNMYEKSLGTRESFHLGIVPQVGDTKPPVPEATWKMTLGTNKYAMSIKALAGFNIRSLLGVNDISLVGVTTTKVTGTFSLTAATIFLN